MYFYVQTFRNAYKYARTYAHMNVLEMYAQNRLSFMRMSLHTVTDTLKKVIKLTHSKDMATLQHNKRALVRTVVSELGQLHRIDTLMEHGIRSTLTARDLRLRALFAADCGAQMPALELLFTPFVARKPGAGYATE